MIKYAQLQNICSSNIRLRVELDNNLFDDIFWNFENLCWMTLERDFQFSASEINEMYILEIKAINSTDILVTLGWRD